MTDTQVARFESRWSPGEWVLAGLLIVSVAVFAWHRATWGAAVLHAGILAGFAGLVAWAAACSQARWSPWLRTLASVTVILTLYSSLAEPSFVAMGGTRDAWLAGIDRFLFMDRDPALLVAPFAHGSVVEILSFVYGWFVPYLYISIFLGCFGRPAAERRRFLFGLSLTYAVAYLGYLFVPARGPIEHYAFAQGLHGGTFYHLVLASVVATGGNHGAFPSLHVGATAYLTFFDLRYNRLRGMTYLPMVALIALSTVVLRYHYVIDILVGLLIAWAAMRVVAPRRIRRPIAGAAWPYRGMRRIFAYALCIYFRDLEVEHFERVPATGPVLLVANHVNAFIDALALVVVLDRPLILVAKSTLRRNPVLRFLMDRFGVIEVHRRQDVEKGAEPKRNVEQLAKVGQRLAAGAAICLFPEGVSHSRPRLQAFRRGAARIALEYERTRVNAPPLQIVPAGIHYEAKGRLRSAVWIRFGTPIDVAEWRTSHGDGAAADLTEEIAAAVRAVTLEHARQREALLVDWAAEVVLTAGREPTELGREASRWPAKVRLMDRLQQALERLEATRGPEIGALVDRLRAYRLRLRRCGVETREVALPLGPPQALFFVLRELELIVFGLPVAVAGVAQHVLPWTAVRSYTRKMSSDPDHWASNAVFAGVFAWPLFLVAEGGLIAWLAGWPWGVLFLAVAPWTLLYATSYLERGRGVVQRAKTFLRFLAFPDVQRELVGEGEAMATEIRRLAGEAGVEVAS